MNLSELSTDTFGHHAYCLIGQRETTRAELFAALEKRCGVRTTGNPDFLYEAFELFGVADAARIKALQANAPVSARRIFIIAANALTAEAQNKLLKMLEEPSERTHFFILIPHKGRLRATVHSRTEILETEKRAVFGGAGEKMADRFLKANAAERLAALLPLIEQEEGGTEAAIEFLNALERVLHKKGGREILMFLEELALMRRYLEGRSPSRKMILEHIALTVPKK
jgi:DNA polymerase III delta prime subunit